MTDLQYSIFKWIVTILSLTGVILNIKKKRLCFYIWAGTNFSWMVVDWIEGIYAQSTLFAVYFILAIWGIYEWKIKLKE